MEGIGKAIEGEVSKSFSSSTQDLEVKMREGTKVETTLSRAPCKSGNWEFGQITSMFSFRPRHQKISGMNQKRTTSRGGKWTQEGTCHWLGSQ